MAEENDEPANAERSAAFLQLHSSHKNRGNVLRQRGTGDKTMPLHFTTLQRNPSSPRPDVRLSPPADL